MQQGVNSPTLMIGTSPKELKASRIFPSSSTVSPGGSWPRKSWLPVCRTCGEAPRISASSFNRSLRGGRSRESCLLAFCPFGGGDGLAVFIVGASSGFCVAFRLRMSSRDGSGWWEVERGLKFERGSCAVRGKVPQQSGKGSVRKKVAELLVAGESMLVQISASTRSWQKKS